MTKKFQIVGMIDAPDWWKMHRIVYSAEGISPCITTKLDHQPNVMITEARQ